MDSERFNPDEAEQSKIANQKSPRFNPDERRAIKNFDKVKEYQKLLPFYRSNKERVGKLRMYLTDKLKVQSENDER